MPIESHEKSECVNAYTSLMSRSPWRSIPEYYSLLLRACDLRKHGKSETSQRVPMMYFLYALDARRHSGRHKS